jgi:hypothetical protein
MIHGRHCGQHEKQQSVRRRVQGKIKRAVHEHGKASGQRTRGDAPAELVFCIASLESFPE